MKSYTVFKNKQALIEGRVLPEDVVLDVGFWGQGVTVASERWPHLLLRKRARDVYGIDLDFDVKALPKMFPRDHYFAQSAEDFSVPVAPTLLFAGDLIEHLSNPGLFLAACARTLASGGRLLITTPNVFNLFDIAQKVVRFEPVTNSDHTCYFNVRTLSQLLKKNGWRVEEVGFVYSLEYAFQESVKKRILNLLYRILALWTPKFLETFFIVAVPDATAQESL